MLDRIERRWRSWTATAESSRQLARWTSCHPVLANWSLLDLDEPRSSPRTDAMQAALVNLAQGGDQAAMLTLLHQLRPGLWCLARRSRAAIGDGRFSAPDDVAAVACETVMRHPLDRRPTSIAANLLLDTRQRLHRTLVAGDYPTVGECHASPVDEPEVRSDDLDLLDRLAEVLGGLTTDPRSRRLSAEVAYRAWILDESAPTIAATVGLRPDAVRARLCRIRAAVRAVEQPTGG